MCKDPCLKDTIYHQVLKDEATFKRISKTLIEQLVANIPEIGMCRCEYNDYVCSSSLKGEELIKHIPLLHTLKQGESVNVCASIYSGIVVDPLLKLQPHRVRLHDTGIHVEIATDVNPRVYGEVIITFAKLPLTKMHTYTMRLKSVVRISTEVRRRHRMLENIDQIPVVIEGKSYIQENGDRVEWWIEVITTE